MLLLLLSSSLSRSRDPDLCQEACGRVCVHSSQTDSVVMVMPSVISNQ